MCCAPINQTTSKDEFSIGKLIGIGTENFGRDVYFNILCGDDHVMQKSPYSLEETRSFWLMRINNPEVYKVSCLRCKRSYWIFHKPEPLFNAVCPDCAEPKMLVGILTGVSSQGFAKEALFVILFEDFTFHQKSGMIFCGAREFYNENKNCPAYQVECADCKERFWVFKKPILLQTHTCLVCSVPK